MIAELLFILACLCVLWFFMFLFFKRKDKKELKRLRENYDGQKDTSGKVGRFGNGTAEIGNRESFAEGFSEPPRPSVLPTTDVAPVKENSKRFGGIFKKFHR